MGYYAMHMTFSNSADFVTQHSDSPCPPALRDLNTPGVCELDETLRGLLQKHDFASYTKKGKRR